MVQEEKTKQFMTKQEDNVWGKQTQCRQQNPKQFLSIFRKKYAHANVCIKQHSGNSDLN